MIDVVKTVTAWLRGCGMIHGGKCYAECPLLKEQDMSVATNRENCSKIAKWIADLVEGNEGLNSAIIGFYEGITRRPTAKWVPERRQYIIGGEPAFFDGVRCTRCGMGHSGRNYCEICGAVIGETEEDVYDE